MQVTIVIPIYNRAEYLLRTLPRVPADYPLIVVDNGSTDGSVALARNFCHQRSNAVFVEEPESGAPAARNRGLALCQTEWIYFFDCDDEFTSLPNVDEATAAANDLLCFPVRMVVEGKEHTRDFRSTADAATQVLCAMLSTQSMLFRTEWLRSIGGWDNRCRIWNDWELGLRALLHRPRLRWISTDSPRHRIYVHPNSITGPSYSARSEAIRDTLAIAFDEAHHADDQRVLRALDFRLAIVCGTLRRQNATAAADRLRCLMAHPGRTLCLIEWSVAHGLRGAWRIALALL